METLANVENLTLQSTLLGDVATVARIARHLDLVRSLRFGPNGNRSEPFACALVAGARGRFDRGPDGRFVYCSWGAGRPLETYAIARLFAARLAGGLNALGDRDWDRHGKADAAGYAARIGPATLVTRLLSEIGAISLPLVPMVPLPPETGLTGRVLWAGMRNLFAARFWAWPDCPVALERGYLSLWAGVGVATVSRGIERLLEQRVIAHIATRPGSKERRGLMLYLPTGIAPPAEWQRRYANDLRRANMARLDRLVNSQERR